MARGRVDNINQPRVVVVQPVSEPENGEDDDSEMVKEEGKLKAGLNDCCRFLYNSDEGTVMGRNGSSWAKIGGFYLIFYSFLAGFFAINLFVMLQTLDPDVPTIVGRTNKPQVAIDEYGSMLLNFGDEDIWNAAITAKNETKTRYDSLIIEEIDGNITKKIFRWTSDVDVECQDVEKYPFGSDSGCFYLGMNRIYNYDPVDGLADGTRFFFDCEFDIGKTGKGDMSGNITSFEVLPSPSTADFSMYYPWTSVATDGYQPLFSVKVTIDRKALKALPKDERPEKAFITCLPYTGIDRASAVQLPESRFARLTVHYPWKLDDVE